LRTSECRLQNRTRRLLPEGILVLPMEPCQQVVLLAVVLHEALVFFEAAPTETGPAQVLTCPPYRTWHLQVCSL